MIPFTNQAALSYNGITKNSNIVSGNIVETLSAVKTAVNTDYSAGENVTYIVNLVNSGTTAYTALTVTDNLGQTAFGAGTVYPLDYVSGTLKYYINGVLQPSPVPAAEKPLTVTGINVPSNGNVMLIYDAKPNEYAPLDVEASIKNTVSITGAGITDVLTATATVNSASGVNLSIVKSVSPSEVAENGQLTYTFIIENYGNTEAASADSIVVTDTFNPILSALAAKLNGNTLTLGTDYTYNEATGEFASVAGKITVPKATFTQNAETGAWTVTPGISTLIVTGTV